MGVVPVDQLHQVIAVDALDAKVVSRLLGSPSEIPGRYDGNASYPLIVLPQGGILLNVGTTDARFRAVSLGLDDGYLVSAGRPTNDIRPPVPGLLRDFRIPTLAFLPDVGDQLFKVVGVHRSKVVEERHRRPLHRPNSHGSPYRRSVCVTYPLLVLQWLAICALLQFGRSRAVSIIHRSFAVRSSLSSPMVCSPTKDRGPCLRCSPRYSRVARASSYPGPPRLLSCASRSQSFVS